MIRHSFDLHRVACFALALGASAMFTSSHASAQKNINFGSSGAIQGTLAFGNYLVPDTYSFFANAGEQIVLQTLANGSGDNLLDTTLRVVGPNAAIDLFDDDGGGNLASRIAFTTPRGGWYIVVVSTYFGNPIGPNDNNGNYAIAIARGTETLLPQIPGEPELGNGNSTPPTDNPVVEK